MKPIATPHIHSSVSWSRISWAALLPDCASMLIKIPADLYSTSLRTVAVPGAVKLSVRLHKADRYRCIDKPKIDLV
jgi:hypothetical protein